MDRNELINNLRNFLSLKDEVLFAYIFGSNAKGRTNSNSDVDIAVYISNIKHIGLEYRLLMIEELQALINKEVDLIIMNNAHPLLLHEIFKYGINIKDTKHNLLVDFRKSSFYKYLDYLYMSNMIFKRNKAKLLGDKSNG